MTNIFKFVKSNRQLVIVSILFALNILLILNTKFELKDIVNTVNYYITDLFLFLVLCLILFFASKKIFIKTSEVYPESKASASIIFTAAPLIIIFTVFSALYNEKLLTLSSAFIAALFVYIGWWLGHATAAQATKSKNTLDVVMNMRSNPIYNENIIMTENFLPNNCFIKKELCQLFANQEKHLSKTCKNNSLLKKEFDNIWSCIRVLNHYEFISNTIFTGQLDEDFIKKCYKTTFIDFEKQTCYLISALREKQPTAYDAYRKLIMSWTGFLYSDECKKNPESSAMRNIGVGVPLYIHN